MSKQDSSNLEKIEEFVHDIRTPLASIQLGATGIKNYLPTILKNYQNLLDGKKVEQPISQEAINLLLKVVDNIESEINRTQKIVTEFMKEMRE